jgi:hypothetical protein
MYFRNPFAIVGGGLFAIAWLALCGLLGYSLFTREDPNAVWMAGIFGTPSSLIFGGISKAVTPLVTGGPNVSVDFFFIAVGGAIQYCLLGIVIGNVVWWLAIKLQLAATGR